MACSCGVSCTGPLTQLPPLVLMTLTQLGLGAWPDWIEALATFGHSVQIAASIKSMMRTLTGGITCDRWSSFPPTRCGKDGVLFIIHLLQRATAIRPLLNCSFGDYVKTFQFTVTTAPAVGPPGTCKAQNSFAAPVGNEEGTTYCMTNVRLELAEICCSTWQFKSQVA